MIWFCEKCCSHQKECGYFSRGMIGDCIFIQNSMRGWGLGQYDLAEEIISMLENYRKQHTKGDLSEYIESFCKGIKV